MMLHRNINRLDTEGRTTMNNDIARSVTNWYATVAATYMDTAAKMYEAHMNLVTEMSKVNIKDIWPQKN